MRVTAEDALAMSTAGILNRSAGDLVGKPQPASTHTIEKTREAFGLRVELLNLVKQLLAHAAYEQIFADEAIELVSMYRQVTLAGVLPHITLIDRHADHMRHQVRQSVIVIPFHPDHFHAALGVGKLADMREKFPMLAGQAAKIEIGEDITEQHQPAKTVRLQHVQGILGTAQIRAQVEV